jgi:hypothetical protein
MTLATKNGRIVLKNGSLSCACCGKQCPSNASFFECDDMVTYQFLDMTNYPGTVVKEIVESRQLITIPASYSLPVTVKFCGGADDGFLIDGALLAPFAVNPPDRTLNTRTFTISVYNAGGPIAGNLTMCFVSVNPLP